MVELAAFCKKSFPSPSMIGVGFMYPQGYFHQHVSSDGWQEEIYEQLNFNLAPIHPCPSQTQCGSLVQLQLADRTLHVRAWQVQVGRVKLYLLDTNLNENRPEDRQLSARLYTADKEHRMQQEIVLGIGGVRILRALGHTPSVWHGNEGHTGFMFLERVREEVEQGASFFEAAENVRSTAVFTTHTPVHAGHDIFPVRLVQKYFRSFWKDLGIDEKTFLALGQENPAYEATFNMTILSLKLSGQRNAVSRLHGTVTRRMWHGLWPEVPEDEVPISHISNGIHVPTWVAPELRELYAKYLGSDWPEKVDDAELWHRVADIPDKALWNVRLRLKRKLQHIVLDRAQNRWRDIDVPAQQVLAMGALLDHDALTLAYVRRFTEYKRPTLIFNDIERIKRIVGDPWRPVQIIFAGKSHPADLGSKYLLHQVHTLASSREFQGRIAFIEDYDMQIARYLVQGVDVWLNTPHRLQEACGTSGMKASLNGVPHLSVRDGWWDEAYNGRNGWVIGTGPDVPESDDIDQVDATSLYDLLETEIIPRYYDRDRSGVSVGWVRIIKETIRSVVPFFCARRMLVGYCRQLYLGTGSARSSCSSAAT